MRGRSAAIVAAGILLAATACATDAGPVSNTVGSSTSTAAVTNSTPTPTPAETTTTTTTTNGERSSTSGPPQSDVGRFVRAADDGATLTLRVGETAVLIQADPFSADPIAHGDAIDLVETVSVAATGDRRWEIRALAIGTATIDAPDGDDAFTITIDVTR